MNCGVEFERSPTPLYSPSLYTICSALTPHSPTYLALRERSRPFSRQPAARELSPSRKYRILSNFSLQNSRQQSRLNLKHSAVTHPIIEQRVRDQRIHP